MYWRDKDWREKSEERREEGSGSEKAAFIKRQCPAIPIRSSIDVADSV